ncbi:MAG TPA: hypothetical protein DIC64_00385 [Alphaproteobacteria bacterium]|nr:hypothetical protein [Alphaproteobacteria bacterium]
MFHMKVSLFSNTKELEHKIDELHDKIIEISMVFKKAFHLFLQEKRSSNYRKLSKEIKLIEHDADTLRRDIESQLYAQNLIPDFRGDVLELVENLDKVINEFDEVAHQFYIENPDIPEVYHAKMKELIDQVCECAENLAFASRAFFRDFSAVRNYSKKVYFLEHESDKTTAKLKESIFASDLELAHKLQLKTFLSEVADIADLAENCVDQLLIYVIKRDI